MKYKYVIQLFEGDGDAQEAQDAAQDAKGEAKYTDEDIDRIIGEKFAKWQKQQDKAVAEAKKLADMSAQERAEAERDALQKELDDLKRANANNAMQAAARKMLQDDGVQVPDTIIARLIGENADDTKKIVTAFSKEFRAAVQAEVKRQLSGKAPATGGANTITKEQILAVADRKERQRLINENLNLFK